MAASSTGLVGLREGTDPIHDTRVAIRRVRSTLRVFGRLLDRDASRTRTLAGQPRAHITRRSIRS
jgi:CHAD domain-containing protein